MSELICDQSKRFCRYLGENIDGPYEEWSRHMNELNNDLHDPGPPEMVYPELGRKPDEPKMGWKNGRLCGKTYVIARKKEDDRVCAKLLRSFLDEGLLFKAGFWYEMERAGISFDD